MGPLAPPLAHYIHSKSGWGGGRLLQGRSKYPDTRLRAQGSTRAY